MIYDSPNHRGCNLASEQKATKRRFFRPGLRMGHNAMLQALKADNDRLAAQQSALDETNQVLFLADVTDIRFLRLQHSKLFPRR